jgi:hypothetical protein
MGQSPRIYADYTQAMKVQIGYMRQLIDIYYDNDACEVFMTPRPLLHLPQAINSILAGALKPGFAIRWRLWLFRAICRLQKRRPLVPKIEWSPPKPQTMPHIPQQAARPATHKIPTRAKDMRNTVV